MRIVLLDDDDAFRKVLARRLTQLLAKQNITAQITAVSTGAAAETAANAQTTDVIIVDLKLENDSGLQWLSRLRASSPQAKIIVLTGYASIPTTMQAIKLGADDYLPKPVNTELLIQHILAQNTPTTSTTVADEPLNLKQLEWEHIQRALEENAGNLSATARHLGMHRRTLQRKLNKYSPQH